MTIKKGDKFPSNNHGEVEVIDYKTFSQVTIIFSCGTIKVVSAGNLRRGEVSPKTSNREVKTLKDYLHKRKEYSNYKIIYYDKYNVHFECSSCNNDIYKSLYPDGKIFKVGISPFKEGKVPCRCNKYFIRTEDEWRILFEEYMGDKGTFKSVNKSLTDGKKYFNWVCNNNHNVLTNISDNINKRPGCPICYDKGKHILYLLKLTRPDGEVFTKIGITVNLPYRLKMYCDEGLVVSYVYSFSTKDIHFESAHQLESKILRLSRKDVGWVERLYRLH